MIDLQASFNKQLPGRGHSLSDTNMNYLVFCKEFLVFNKVSKYGNINFVALLRVGMATKNRAYSYSQRLVSYIGFYEPLICHS